MKKIIKKTRRAVGRIIPERIKSVIRRAIRRIKPVGNPTIPIEELKIFELLKDKMSVVFDVGAREDLSFYHIKSDCSYHLFEPSSEAIISLKKQISLLHNHNIKLNEFGLSDKEENNCIYYKDSQSFIINPLHMGIDTGIRYSLKTLDKYVDENNIPHIDLLKIDAEGLDYKIITGGLSSIKTKVSYIQFEYWDSVKKFVDILGNTFNFYLMMEPVLYEAITEDVFDSMTKNQQNKDYTKLIILLDQDIIDLIDKTLIPLGYGGNILGISRNPTIINADSVQLIANSN